MTHKILAVLIILFTQIIGCSMFVNEEKNVNEELRQAFKDFYNQNKYQCKITELHHIEYQSGAKSTWGNNNDYQETLIFNAPDLLYQEIKTHSGTSINCYKGNRFTSPKNGVFVVVSGEIPDSDLYFFDWPPSPSRQFKILEGYFYPCYSARKEGEILNAISSYDGTKYKDNILCDIITIKPSDEIRTEILKPITGAKITGFQLEFWVSQDKALIQKVIYDISFERLGLNVEIGKKPFIDYPPHLPSPSKNDSLMIKNKIIQYRMVQEKSFDYGEDFIIPVSIVENTDPGIKRIYTPIPIPEKDKRWDWPKEDEKNKPE